MAESVSNCTVLMVATEVDGIGGSDAVWRATNIINNFTVWAAEGGNVDVVWRAAYISGDVLRSTNCGGGFVHEYYF